MSVIACPLRCACSAAGLRVSWEPAVATAEAAAADDPRGGPTVPHRRPPA